MKKRTALSLKRRERLPLTCSGKQTTDWTVITKRSEGRVCVFVWGRGGEVRSVCVHRHKFTECTSKLYYDDRTPPTHPPPTSLQVFLTPAPLPNLLSRSPFLLFLCRTWDLLPVDGKSLCVIVKLCIVYVCVWRKNTEHVNDCV